MSTLTIKAALDQASKVLSTSVDNARLEVELLLTQVLKKSRSYLFTWPDKVLDQNQIKYFNTLVQERLKGTPIAYILGKREFWTLDLTVTSDTLIPRPETELLVELALEQIPLDANYQVLDLGTGTGAIALAIASERPNSHITAIDQSTAALTVAQLNAQRHQITNISFLESNWFTTLDQQSTRSVFNIIISNPPYIANNDVHLIQGDVRFEPMSALVSGEKGLDDIRTIIESAPKFLARNSWLLIEHGYEQGREARELFQNRGFSHIKTIQDLSHNDRVTLGHYN